MKSIVGRTISVHTEHEFLLKLEAAGLNDELAQKVIESKNNNLAGKIISLIDNDGFEPTTNQKKAREIMGKNYFGIKEGIKYFGVNPTHQEITALSEIPFPEAVLEKTKDTHILVAIFPISIIEIQRQFERYFLNKENSWYNKKFFAKENGELGWQLVLKKPVENSILHSWQKQQTLIGEENEVPHAQTMVYTIIGHYLASGERLFENICVRTASMTFNGSHICVGNFNLNGLAIINLWDSYRSNTLGVCCARKIQKFYKP